MKLINYIITSLCVYVFLCNCSSVNENSNHKYVDLKLPSGVLWATCNIGSNSPYDYGDYFSWGEVKTKNDNGIETYKWCVDGDGYKLSKYCLNSDFGTVDGKTVLETSDDAATVNWGGKWRMPTQSEIKELIDGCKWYSIHNYNNSGVAGRLGISKVNGDSIFFPTSGHKFFKYKEPLAEGNVGCAWSSSNCENGAYQLFFDLDSFMDVCSVEKSIGCPIRPVMNQ